MLLKVNPYNWNLGTIEIKKYIEQLSPPYHFESILDNEEGYLFILLQNKKMIGWDCKKNRIIYGIHRFKIKIDNLYFWKQMTSFHQNNSLIANKIRTHVIRQFKYQSSCIHQTNTVIGIGGEYYVYFPFILGTNYIGISNHSCIIEDAIFNSRLYIQNDTHHLVNYNNIETFPILDISKRYFVIINISSIHQNQIEWIKDMDIEKLVIITCHSYHSKFPLLLKYFKCVGIKSFQNISGYVYILTFIKKIKYISLGSNCSVTYHLNKLGLRKKSYPFDWCRIHIHQIIDVLEHQFYLYEKIDYNTNVFDRTINIWNPYNGILIRTLKVDPNFNYISTVLPDGSLVSTSSDYSIKIWNLNDGSLIDRTYKLFSIFNCYTLRIVSI